MTKVLTEEQASAAIEKWREANPLRKWRLKKEGAQSTVALRIGVSVTTVRYWEWGLMVPSRPNFEKLAKLLGIKRLTLAEKWDDWIELKPDLGG